MTKSALLFSVAAAALTISCTQVDSTNDTAEQSSAQTAKPDVEVTDFTDADMLDAGLNVGDKAPMDVQLDSAAGRQKLSEILEDGPAVIVFTRSINWCPFCQAQLKTLNDAVGDFTAQSYKLYGLSYDSAEDQAEFVQNQNLDFAMLSDSESNAIDAFGLRDPPYTEGMAVGVPYASVYVIAKDGTITAKSVSGDYKKRPTNADVLGLL